MPELPEVQMLRQYLEARCLGRRVSGVEVRSAYVVKGASLEELARGLVGRELVRTLRHGKYLFAGLEPAGWLVLHFGMSGNLRCYSDPEPEPRYTQVRLDFGRAHLAFISPRKLSALRLADEPDAFIRERRLGPDALDPLLDLEAFHAALARGRAPVKAALMDQHRVAGIGNLYADEILFQAGVHPCTRLPALTGADVEGLYRQMRSVLRTAVEAQGEFERYPTGFLLRDRREGGRCAVDGSSLVRTQVAGRTTYFCPAHQGVKGE